MELPLDAMLELASITHEVQIAVQKSIEQRDPVELAELKECLEEMAELAIQDVTLDSPWYVYAAQLRGLQHRIQGVLNTLNSN